MMTRNYLRKHELWAGGLRMTGSKDITFMQAPVSLHLVGNVLDIRRDADITVSINEIPTDVLSYAVQKGDSLSFGGISLIFFDERIEITADENSYKTTLAETHGEEEYFPGFPIYKRSPRIIYRVEPEKIEITPPPRKKEIGKNSFAQMIIPPLVMLAFTIFMGIILKRGAYIYMTAGMTVITTIMSVQRFFSQRKQTKQDNERREVLYDEYLLNVRSKIRTKRAKERQALDYQNPTLQTIEKMIGGYSSRIYERSGVEDDFLQVNLGYYEGSSQIEVTFHEHELDITRDPLVEQAKRIPREHDKIPRIPVQVDLKRSHVGLVGSKANVHEQLKCLLAQLTFFQSYHDLQFVFIHDAHYNSDFAYTRWYPHMRLSFINAIGEISSEQTRDQILGSIQQILKERKQKLAEEKQDTVFLPHLVFIIDEPKLILNHAIMEYLQEQKMELGFSLIYTTDQQANLPENIRTVCLLNNAEEATLLLNEGERINRSFLLQHTEGVALEYMARNLAALIHEQGVSSRIPESITFFDLFHIKNPQELDVQRRWSEHNAHKSLAVPLGERAKDDIVELNLHEKAHGPHGLVAGTTGSGKSEIVQSYILSLAANFHPYDVGFLLIDYKGGGMANLFKNLPHLLGTITNLDKAESMRAMESIKSEMHRRERIFGECGVNHINGYSKLFKLGKVQEPLPHLFLISDEFAELKKEQPEFMAELVSAARVGRSLGIHLILATQKPSGVVDDQIWTNSRFKLCLKVQNAADSKEMLHTPDAANITQAGRAYLQVGNNEIYELFQSAFSGATYSTDEEKQGVDDRVYLLNEIGQGELINHDLGGSKEDTKIKKTQLDVTVDYIHDLYEKTEHVSVKPTWLPPLPDHMESPYTKEAKDSASFDKGDYTLGLGMIDIPEEQLQEEYMVDLENNGHLLYMASSGYGKSVFLTNLALGLAMKNAVKNLHFYILDLGNSALITLRGLPHTADYMGLDDVEKVYKFERIISEEIAERKRQFAKVMAQNIRVYNETQDKKLPAIVILVDNYDAIKEFGDTTEAFLQKVSRDGAGLGIYLAVTITRMNVMRGATMNNFKERIAGYNFESNEPRSLVGRTTIVLPDDKHGRVLIKKNGINLMQLYTPVPCKDELQYARDLKELVDAVAAASTEEKAVGIPMLPDELTPNTIRNYPGYVEDPDLLPIGIDTEKLKVQYMDFNAGIIMVVGSIGSGKTNVVRTLLRQTPDQDVYLFDGKEGNLLAYRDKSKIHYAADQDAIIQLNQTIATIVEVRSQQYAEERVVDPSLTIKDFVAQFTKSYIVIDTLQDYCNIFTDTKDIDILSEAVRFGMRLLVTVESRIPRIIKSGFIDLLSVAQEGVVLGNAREQSVFPSTRIREDNHDQNIGYVCRRGEYIRIMKLNEEEGTIR